MASTHLVAEAVGLSTTEGPSITIGMPLHNGAEFLERALKGIVAQTYTDFKVVMSDDASTDRTWEIIQRWAARDNRLVVHRQGPNLGHTENFRFVLDQADTEYFMWHAQDDWVAPNYLEELLRVMRSEEGCAFVAPRVVLVSTDGTEYETIDVPSIPSGTRFGRTRRLLAQSWGMRFYGLFRTEQLRSAKELTEQFGTVWGWDAIIQLPFMLQDEMRATNATVLYYRPNDASMKTYKPQQRLALLRFWLHYLRFNLRAWRTSELPAFHKLLCLPWVLFHSVHSLRLRPWQTAVKLIRRPIRRFLKALVQGPVRALSGGK